MPKWLFCFFILGCMGCDSKPVANKPVAKVLDSTSVCFNGAILDHDAIVQLKQATLSAEEWSNVLPVMLQPANNDDGLDEETPIAGNYTLNDTAIVFTAQKPFVKHRQYVARFYSSDMGLSYLKMAQAKPNLKGPGPLEFSFKVE